ncbi:MAG TPA: glycosyltransferase family A protein [Desulfomonilaceae bacterium]|nr:glycosyltransferase family A protein [Desulfomonilaceae bacterium]
MNQSTPLVSVIIPAYNCERYIEEAIHSVLAQTYTSTEIIVIDDGSTDATADAVMKYRPLIKYEFETNRGPDSARNYGIDLAEGSFLAFLDADDLWVRDKLELQLDAFANDTKLDAVFGHIEQFITPELGENQRPKIMMRPGPIAGYTFETMLIKRDSFLEVGKFNTDHTLGAFLEWYARAREAGLKTLMLTEIVAKRRLHLNNLGIRQAKAQSDYLRVVKGILDKRRKSD